MPSLDVRKAPRLFLQRSASWIITEVFSECTQHLGISRLLAYQHCSVIFVITIARYRQFVRQIVQPLIPQSLRWLSAIVSTRRMRVVIPTSSYDSHRAICTAGLSESRNIRPMVQGLPMSTFTENEEPTAQPLPPLCAN